jgi:hypothetical protein
MAGKQKDISSDIEKGKNTKKVFINADSEFRNSDVFVGTNKFVISLLPSRPIVKSITLRNIIVPFEWYVIRENINDKFYFTDGASSAQVAIVSPGTYTISNFITELQTKINAASSSGVFTITRIKHRNHLVITIDSGTFEINSNTMTNQAIWDVIGFSTLTDKTGASTYEAEERYNMSGDDYIYLKSSLASRFIDDIVVESGYKEVLTKIPITNGYGFSNVFQPAELITVKLNALILEEMDFELVFKDFEPLDLNGATWSLSYFIEENEILHPDNGIKSFVNGGGMKQKSKIVNIVNSSL